MSDDLPIGHAPRITAIAADIPLGAHLKTDRRGYVHHGIYVGNGEVVHYVGFKSFLRCGPVEKTSLAGFADGRGFRVEPATQARYIEAEIVRRRATARLGEDDYRILTNNCEHFCRWCLSGESRSEQVEALLSHPWRALQAIVGVLCSAAGILGQDLAARVTA
ncbi:lecithin retinol acyltransferase family protein [Cupriavidus sp. IK-TO18]|uniref:lecithin retinol acyltransferase family protein n=1 Tax=Cupriavidus sp. IK-TO18 TaxID=2782182 RepID=UPI00189895E9|nr:lecithin retinol acyltransferase family protein [Cupriavidus sp. IK-TO18]MBF6990047.1 lecithin retinol acyltransferase family protein [Cupriavidus sp. IK-TO18]